MLNNGITVELGQPVDETIFRDIFGYESAEAFCADFGGNCTLQASYKWTKSAEDQLANSGFEVKAGELISQAAAQFFKFDSVQRSEEHTSELQSLMRISYAVFCLKKTITDLTKRHDIQNK